MADARHERLRRLFDRAIELPTSARGAFVDAECGGDAELKQRLTAMLAAAEDEHFLAAPSGPRPGALADTEITGVVSLREGPGTRIGPYKLLQLIGEGGFGAVFLAEQEKPVARRVALKIIKLGMDTRQVVARFEQERQALALMDHPNIARVIDAGATDTGRPYFVMDLVKGDPIAQYCDENHLTIDERLDLFAQVCNAVQHAHQKGIIHRDIKPSNVLVSTQDGRPLAKVIDFGIAKATSSKLTDKTLFTEHQQIIGTLQYMSPEQAAGSLDIDTRTDVYSLGVLLYELLTGSTPFDKNTIRDAMFSEIHRMIREVDPPKPSTRLSQSAAEIASIAAQRGVEPKRLGSILRGELDWIVMKALEKDRARRYETANGLAMDIRRYLGGDAVVAAPPSASYRLRKFVQRNRIMVSAGAAVAVALVLGLLGTIWQANVASAQRDKARSEADRAVAAEAESHRRADELQRVADFQGQMLAQVDPTTAGVRLAQDVRTRFDAALEKSGVAESERTAQVESFVGQWSRINETDTALELIDTTILAPAVAAIDKQFVDQPAIAATLRHVLAERYHDLGLDQSALALEQRAVADRRRVLGEDHSDTLLSISNLGTYSSALGKEDEAEVCYREALEKSRRVHGDDDPRTLTSIANLGSLLLEKGQTSEAEPYVREALERRRRVLGDEHPDTLSSISDWATLLKAQGKPSEAERYFREALAKRRRVQGEEHRDTLRSINDLAALLEDQGKLDEAVTCFREVVEKRRRLLGEVHPVTLTSIQNLGTALDASGHPDEAEALMREALATKQRLLGADHSSTLVTLGNLAVLLIGRGRFTEAEPICRETLERRRRVLGENHSGTLIANNVMGLVLIRQGKFAEGEPYWREALATAQRVLGPAHPETLTYMHNLAGLAKDEEKPAEAEQLFREVIRIGAPAIGAGHPVVLSSTRKLGSLLVDQKRDSEAAPLLSTAEPEARKLYTGANEHLLAALLMDLGSARYGLHQFASAESSLVEAHAILVRNRGEIHADTRDCRQSLVDLYSAWDKVEPGKGYDAKAAEWQARMDAAK